MQCCLRGLHLSSRWRFFYAELGPCLASILNQAWEKREAGRVSQLQWEALGKSVLKSKKTGGIIGQHRISEDMMDKNTTARAYGVILATMFAIMVTLAVYEVWPGLHTSMILLMFIGLWVGFFLTGIWIITREFPISGAERRRRNKQFYDWLRSQGRH